MAGVVSLELTTPGFGNQCSTTELYPCIYNLTLYALFQKMQFFYPLPLEKVGYNPHIT